MNEPYAIVSAGQTVVLKVSEETEFEELRNIGRIWKQATGRAPLALVGDIDIVALIDTRRYASRKARS